MRITLRALTKVKSSTEIYRSLLNIYSKEIVDLKLRIREPTLVLKGYKNVLQESSQELHRNKVIRVRARGEFKRAAGI